MDELRLQYERERNDGGGDSLGIVKQLLGLVDEEGGVVGLLRNALTGGNQDTSLLGVAKEAMSMLKEYGQLAKTQQALPESALPSKKPAQQPAPAQQDQPQFSYLDIKDDDPDRIGFKFEGREFVRTEIGWGMRPESGKIGKGLIAVMPEKWAELDAMLVKMGGPQLPPIDPPASAVDVQPAQAQPKPQVIGSTPEAPPDLDDEDEDEDDDQDQEGDAVWNLVENALGELAPLITTFTNKLSACIELEMFDHGPIVNAMLLEYRSMAPELREKVRAEMNDDSNVALLTKYLPSLMPKVHRQRVKTDPAIGRVLEEVVAGFRAGASE